VTEEIDRATSTQPFPSPHHDRRWLILSVIGIAELMVVLDVIIVNIALPSAQQDLGFSDDARQWVITAYALAFGSLLLLGGRIADLFGRKWTFIAGPGRLRRRVRHRRCRWRGRRCLPRATPSTCRPTSAARVGWASGQTTPEPIGRRSRS
jgi:Major Facilitator Superfamily